MSGCCAPSSSWSASRISPAQMPHVGLPDSTNSLTSPSRLASTRPWPMAVDSPPGRMRASTPESSNGVRTSTPSTPGWRSSAAMCSAKPPWMARTPTFMGSPSAPITGAWELRRRAAAGAAGPAVGDSVYADADAKRPSETMRYNMAMDGIPRDDRTLRSPRGDRGVAWTTEAWLRTTTRCGSQRQGEGTAAGRASTPRCRCSLESRHPDPAAEERRAPSSRTIQLDGMIREEFFCRR